MGGSVSIVIPAYNAAATLAAALASVRQQAHPVAEVIVIDDGSTDGTADVAQAAARQVPGVQLVRQANAGPAAARNRGLALAAGDLVAFLDADDLWPPGGLAVLAGVLAAEPSLGAVLGHTRDLWEVAEEAPRLGPAYLSFNVGGALFRRSVFERVGVFDPALRNVGEDIDLWVRIGEERIPRRTVADVTLHYRRKLVNRVDGARQHRASLAGALKRSLDRQRRAGRTPL